MGLTRPSRLLLFLTLVRAELAKSGYYNGTIFHRIIKVGGPWAGIAADSRPIRPAHE